MIFFYRPKIVWNRRGAWVGSKRMGEGRLCMRDGAGKWDQKVETSPTYPDYQRDQRLLVIIFYCIYHYIIVAYKVVSLNCAAELEEYIDKSQLTEELGGSLQYRHVQWVQYRTVSTLICSLVCTLLSIYLVYFDEPVIEGMNKELNITYSSFSRQLNDSKETWLPSMRELLT